MVLKFDLVSQESADSSESLHKLESFLRLVSDELQFRSELGIVGAKPLCKLLSLYHVVSDLRLCITEELGVLLLSWCDDEDLGVSLNWVFENIAVSLDVFEKHKCL